MMAGVVERPVFIAFKRVVKELRKTNKGFGRNSALFKYLRSQMRDSITQRVYSKAPEETKYVADLFSTYLSSTRRLTQLEVRYRGGERSVEESAKLVGLSLPEKK